MITAIVCTIIAWVIGLVIDANLMFNDCGFLMLRVLLPLITMGAFILKSKSSKDE
ncbi:MAG: hypothetical protein IJO52_06295 [Clostridia bacterium]|nr:hypothetical protein [Clostridia bacterium]